MRMSASAAGRENESGQGLTEYLILLILISVISIGAVRSLGSTIKRKLETATRNINTRVDLQKDDDRG